MYTPYIFEHTTLLTLPLLTHHTYIRSFIPILPPSIHPDHIHPHLPSSSSIPHSNTWTRGVESRSPFQRLPPKMNNFFKRKWKLINIYFMEHSRAFFSLSTLQITIQWHIVTKYDPDLNIIRDMGRWSTVRGGETFLFPPVSEITTTNIMNLFTSKVWTSNKVLTRSNSSVNCNNRHTLPYDFSVKGDVLSNIPRSRDNEVGTKLRLRYERWFQLFHLKHLIKKKEKSSLIIDE